MRLMHTHRFLNGSVLGRDNRPYNETRFIAVGSLSIALFIFLIGVITHTNVDITTVWHL